MEEIPHIIVLAGAGFVFLITMSVSNEILTSLFMTIVYGVYQKLASIALDLWDNKRR